jgi:hypothetical protein
MWAHVKHNLAHFLTNVNFAMRAACKFLSHATWNRQNTILLTQASLRWCKCAHTEVGTLKDHFGIETALQPALIWSLNSRRRLSACFNISSLFFLCLGREPSTKKRPVPSSFVFPFWALPVVHLHIFIGSLKLSITRQCLLLLQQCSNKRKSTVFRLSQ